MQSLPGFVAALGFTCAGCGAMIDVWSPEGLRVEPRDGGRAEVFLPPLHQYVCPGCWLDTRGCGPDAPETERFLRHRSVSRAAGIPESVTTIVMDVGPNPAKAWTKGYRAQLYATSIPDWPQGDEGCPDRPSIRVASDDPNGALLSLVVFAALIWHEAIPDAHVEVVWPFSDMLAPRSEALLGIKHLTPTTFEKLKRGLGFFDAEVVRGLRGPGRPKGSSKATYDRIYDACRELRAKNRGTWPTQAAVALHLGVTDDTIRNNLISPSTGLPLTWAEFEAAPQPPNARKNPARN